MGTVVGVNYILSQTGDQADTGIGRGLEYPAESAGATAQVPTKTEDGIEWADPMAGAVPVVGKGINLLDDWYFQNAVNQRAVALNTAVSATNPVTYNFIDRWKLTSGSATLTASGVTLNGTMVQILENAIGATVTASALLSDGTMITPSYNDSTKTLTLTASNKTIVAVKLELGDTQTLARNIGTEENPNWVLNDPPPNYEQELAKCQRYQYIPRPVSDWYPIGWAQCVSQSQLIVTLSCPVPFRSNPAIKVASPFRLSTGADGIEITDATSPASRACGTLIRADLNLASPNSNLVAGQMYLVIYRFNTVTPFIFDANL